MKRFITIGAVVSLLLVLTPAVHSQSNQLMQGTQLRLVLLSGLSTSVARDGDPFTATVAEPVYLGGQLILPAGAKVYGTVANIERPRRFSMFRGGASMNLLFRSIEIDGRELPARMSIISIYKPSADGGRARKDVHAVEGVAVEEGRDIKGDIVDAALGTGGGTLVGAVFSHVVRGFAFGLIGSSAYVVAKKGKDVELPAQTAFLVRLDSSVALPAVLTRSGAYSSGGTR